MSSSSGPSSVDTREIVFPSVRQVEMEAMVRRKDEGEKDGKMEEGGQEQRGKGRKEGGYKKRWGKEGERQTTRKVEGLFSVSAVSGNGTKLLKNIKG